jgi:hypothetical protein
MRANQQGRSIRRRDVMRLMTLVVGAGLPISCGLEEGAKDTEATRSALKDELGIDADVAFTSFTGIPRNRMTVVVKVKSKMSGDPMANKMKIEEVVRRYFRQPIDRIQVL